MKTQILTVLCMILIGCGNEEGDAEASDQESAEHFTSTTQPPQPEVTPPATYQNTLPETISRPSPVCGELGFTYLLKEYFYPKCGACHASGDIATPDVSIAYPLMVRIDDEKLLKVIRTGQFCTEDCRLEVSDPLYLEIAEWQGCKND